MLEKEVLKNDLLRHSYLVDKRDKLVLEVNRKDLLKGSYSLDRNVR